MKCRINKIIIICFVLIGGVLLYIYLHKRSDLDIRAESAKKSIMRFKDESYEQDVKERCEDAINLLDKRNEETHSVPLIIIDVIYSQCSEDVYFCDIVYLDLTGEVSHLKVKEYNNNNLVKEKIYEFHSLIPGNSPYFKYIPALCYRSACLLIDNPNDGEVLNIKNKIPKYIIKRGYTNYFLISRLKGNNNNKFYFQLCGKNGQQSNEVMLKFRFN